MAFCSLPAIDAKVVYKCGRHAIRVEGNVEVFVNKEIVSRSLAHDTKIVNERFLTPYFRIELVLSDTRGLILVSRRLAVAANPLRLEMGGGMDSSGLVHSEAEQYV
jgi:hypothetical protein